MSRSPPELAWPAARAQHRLWLGPQGGATRSRRGFSTFGAPQPFGAAAEPGAAPQADALFAAWCAQHPDSHCDVLLSGHLVHSLLLDDAAAAGASVARLQGQARQHWSRFHGAAALGWPVAVDATAVAAVACATDGFDVTAARAVARRHRVRLRSVQPAWAGALAGVWAPVRATARQPTLRLALAEPGLITWLAVDAGRFVALGRVMIDAADRHPPALLRALLPPADMAWQVVDAGPSFDLASPAAALPAPDFLADARQPGAAAWGLLAAGVAALAVSLLDARAQADALDAQRDRVAAVERAAPRRPTVAGAPAPTPAQLTAARSAHGMAARLQHPWATLFGAVEQASAGRVQLLSFAHDAAASGGDALRIDGIAADADALTAFMRSLTDSAALRDVSLRRQQGATGLRFEVAAGVRQ